MKREILHPICIVFALFVGSCSYDSNNSCLEENNDYMALSIDNHFTVSEVVSWHDIMDRMVTKGPDLLSECDVQLMHYDYVYDITKENLSEVIQIILGNDSTFPKYNDKSICGFISKNEIDAMGTDNDMKYNFENRHNYIVQNVQSGMGLVRLDWLANERKYSSYCVVSDSSIVYDDFVTNAVIFETNTIESTNKLLKTREEAASFTGTKSWNLTATANWLWGDERGYAEITHQCYYSRGKIVGQDSSASSYMSKGNSVAETTEVKYNKIAYGYGLSTPLVSVSLSFNNGAYTVSFSPSSSSTTSGTGTHIFVE